MILESILSIGLLFIGYLLYKIYKDLDNYTQMLLNMSYDQIKERLREHIQINFGLIILVLIVLWFA